MATKMQMVYFVATPNELWKELYPKGGEYTWYEVILDGTTCKLYFDLDVCIILSFTNVFTSYNNLLYV